MNNESSKSGQDRDHEWSSKNDPKLAPKINTRQEKNKKNVKICVIGQNKGPTNMPLSDVDHKWNEH